MRPWQIVTIFAALVSLLAGALGWKYYQDVRFWNEFKYQKFAMIEYQHPKWFDALHKWAVGKDTMFGPEPIYIPWWDTISCDEVQFYETDKSWSLRDLRRFPAIERFEFEDVTLSIADMKELASHKHVKAIGFNDTQISDEALAECGAFHELCALSIIQIERNSGLTGFGLRALRSAPHLTTLTLYGVELSDEGFDALGDLESIETLEFVGSYLNADRLRCLGRLPRLKNLMLQPREVQREGLLNAFAGLQKLESLTFDRIPPSNENLQPLTALQNLNDFWLSGLSGQSLEPLAQLRKLTHLSLRDLSGQSLKPLTELGSLKHLWVGDSEMSDEQLIGLSGCAGLEELTLCRIKVTGTAFQEPGWASLKKLTLYEVPVNDFAATAIKSLPNLVSLETHKTEMTAEVLTDIKGFLARRPKPEPAP